MSSVLRVATMACLLLAITIVASLHTVSELDPILRRLSEYATGPGGVLMTVAFFLVGVGLSSSGGIFIRNASLLPGVALVLAGIGMILAGMYPTDPDSATVAEEIHSTASAVATGLVVFASLRVSFFGQRKSSIMRLVAGAGLLLAVVSVVLSDTSVSGLSQRLLWMTLLWWWCLPLGSSARRIVSFRECRWVAPRAGSERATVPTPRRGGCCRTISRLFQ